MARLMTGFKGLFTYANLVLVKPDHDRSVASGWRIERKSGPSGQIFEAEVEPLDRSNQGYSAPG